MSKPGFSLNDKKSKFSLIVEQRIRNTSEINHVHAGDEQVRRDQQLLHGQLLAQNRDLREAQMKSFHGMEELKRVQESTSDTFSMKRLIDDRDTILELTGKIQEIEDEVDCMNDSRDFEDAESARSDIPTFPVNQRFSTFPKSWWNAEPFSGNAEPQR